MNTAEVVQVAGRPEVDIHLLVLAVLAEDIPEVAPVAPLLHIHLIRFRLITSHTSRNRQNALR